MAGERLILSWNVTNWITVVLMVAVLYGVLAVVQQLVLKAKERQGAA